MEVLGGPWRSLGSGGLRDNLYFPSGAFLCLFSLRFPLFLRFGAPESGALICDFSLRFPLNSPKRAPDELKD